MDDPSERRQPVSPAFTEIIGRALTDEDFRTRLFEDRTAALEGHQLADKRLGGARQHPARAARGAGSPLRPRWCHRHAGRRGGQGHVLTRT